MTLVLTEPQKVEAGKALAGQSYDFMVIRDGFESHEDLLTDADIAFLVADMTGQITMTPEHKTDVKQRMTDAVPMTPGLDANTLFDRLQRGVHCPKGTIDPYDEERIVKLTDEQIMKFTVDATIDHHEWFRSGLIENGAPETITYEQVKASAGFDHSQEAYIAGYLKGKSDLLK